MCKIYYIFISKLEGLDNFSMKGQCRCVINIKCGWQKPQSSIQIIKLQTLTNICKQTSGREFK